MVPLLYDRLTRNPESASFDFKRWMEVRLMPPAVVGIEHLGAYAGQVARNNLRFFSELNKYLTHLEKDNISVILLKGAWLAQGIYSSIGLREMNDMDLLFRLEDLPAAWSILSNMGYRPERPVHIDYEITKSHHLPPVLKKGVAVFELHWNITGPGRYYSIPQDGLHDRADDHTIGGQTIKALSPEDQLLHLCLHTSYQHLFSFGLRPYCDIDATITHYSNSLDWDQFTDRAAEYGWSKGTWLALAMARDLLGAEVPEEVLDELRPQGDSAYEGEKTVIQMCEEQLFTKKTVAALVQPHMMDMLDGMGITRKAKIIWGRVCLPKETMMIMYNVKPGSVWIYAYYLLRLWQLIYRHTWNVFRLYRGDAVLSGVAVRKKFLGEFLCGEGEGKIAELSAERSQHPSH
ncbi:MAG: nucleotidyltransferase family protein [Balneolales bacterium]